MPFTVAHAAAVVPFLRLPVVPLALIAGSMAPDLPYFMGVVGTGAGWYEALFDGVSSHEFSQILPVGLPLALVLAGFLGLVERPVRWALPKSWIPEKYVFGRRPPNRAYAVLWTFHSLLLGLLTHLVWDSFTHSSGWVVRQVPSLALEPFAGIPLYRLIQHGSSIAGLAILVLWYLKWHRTSITHGRAGVPVRRKVSTILLALGLVVPAAATAILGLGASPVPEDAASTERFLQIMILRSGAALIASLTAYAMVWHAVGVDRQLRIIRAAQA